MNRFEDMTDDEFNSPLCEPLREFDKVHRKTVAAQGRELAPDYRAMLVEHDRYMMEPVDD